MASPLRRDVARCAPAPTVRKEAGKAVTTGATRRDVHRWRPQPGCTKAIAHADDDVRSGMNTEMCAARRPARLEEAAAVEEVGNHRGDDGDLEEAEQRHHADCGRAAVRR
jgi:hypothetical protein